MIPISRPLLGPDDSAAVLEVLESGRLVQGEKVAAFEAAFSASIGVRNGVATSSGTAALQLAVEALGLKKGTAVITTPLSFIASSNALLVNHLTPVFADIDPRTFTVDPGQIESRITDKTTAVLVVHLYGHPCDMTGIRRICDDHGLMLIEDCAQALGAAHRGRNAGSFGDVACFSFYPSKNMTTGEGGMVVTGNEDIAGRIRLLRNHGQTSTYVHERLGYNFRMTDMQAALGLAQLKKVGAMNQKRTAYARHLSEHLQGLDWLETPAVDAAATHAWHQYTIKTAMRDAALDFLRRNGIDARIYYPKLIYQQPVYQKRRIRGSCPVAEDTTGRVLSLPVHPGLTGAEMETIVRVCSRFDPAGGA